MIKYKDISRDEYYKLACKDGAYHLYYDEGIEVWFVDDKFHREDGPAVIRLDGSKNWFYNDNELHKPWFLDHPNMTTKMQVWELFTPYEIVKMRLTT
jgi:hypothetical protein